MQIRLLILMNIDDIESVWDLKGMKITTCSGERRKSFV